MCFASALLYYHGGISKSTTFFAIFLSTSIILFLQNCLNCLKNATEKLSYVSSYLHGILYSSYYHRRNTIAFILQEGSSMTSVIPHLSEYNLSFLHHYTFDMQPYQNILFRLIRTQCSFLHLSPCIEELHQLRPL